MDSSRTRNVRKRTDPVNLPAARYITGSRRTPSWSSLSSLSSSSSNSIVLHDSPLNSPATPLRLISGVPFSWEKLPGIPKKLQNNINRNESPNLLPLPPQLNHKPTTRKNTTKTRKNNIYFVRDPFVTALVECSKDNDGGGGGGGGGDDDVDPNLRRFRNNGRSSKALSENVSDRFGFVNLSGSCRRTCTVSESIIHLPRSTRASYTLLHDLRRRSR